MYSKIIFVLATFCIVNASVLTVNVYNDDAETEVKVRPSRCKSKACDWLCHRLNKTNGTCVEGHCKCDKSPIAEDEDDMTDPVELLSPGDCNLRACEQLCRRLGFPGGVCVNGRCKCDNFLKTNDVNDMTDPAEKLLSGYCKPRACLLTCRKRGYPRGNCVKESCQCNYLLNTKDAVTELNVDEDSVQPRSCNNKRCNQICRKQKFRGGACVGANCYCNKFLSLQDDTLTDSEENLSLRSCNSIACDDQCRRTGWHSGVCINGQCKCDYFLYKQGDAVSENSFFNVQDLVTPKRCTPEACSVLCRRLKLGEGVCDGSRCRCSNYKPTPKVVMADLDESIPLDDNFPSDNSLSTKDADDMTDPAESLSPGDCNLRACEQLCRRLGFPGGACVNGRCSCDNFLNSKDADDMTDPAELVSPGDCNLRACEQLCRRLGFPGGVCVNGRCKCDNFLGTQVDAVEEYLGLATRRVCHVRKCNRTCTRGGYAGARCVNGRCECYDKIERQDSSILNDVTRDINEESNEILSTNAEEPIETAPSSCNTVFCNQMCHRLKYAGGWCRFGQCQCY
ncbi:hypothetical protein PYW07_015794 [Mythimna separata]|uniref:Knottins-like domain-containing protein n=1 Tax=Mythimna separata TaxID=271217 RepID=A0AAD7YRX9_MYTSE|nr:hypothetical protein PYW07_015794 [Mythimna separata]